MDIISSSNIIHLPLAFVRSGDVNSGVAEIRYTGSHGHGWSRNTHSVTVAYYLGVTSNEVYSSYSNGRRYVSPSAANIIHLPLAFVRSGDLNLNDGKLWSLKQYGFYWSPISQSVSISYSLRITLSDANTLYAIHRWRGFPLRCQHHPLTLGFCP